VKPQTLADFGPEQRPSGEQINFRHCPECGRADWKVYVARDSGAWICFACNGRGAVRVLRDEDAIRRRLQRYAPERPTWPEIEFPMTSEIRVPFGWLAQKYGLTFDEVQDYSIDRVTPSGRVIVPFYDKEGRLIYYTARTMEDEKPKYVNAVGLCPLYVPEWAMLRNYKGIMADIVLVEGVFDAIKVRSRLGLCAIAIGGKTLARYLLPSIVDLAPKQVTIALDSDAFGASLRLSRLLSPFVETIRRVKLPVGKDPGGMSTKELEIAFQ
jgi:DNA primase